MKFIFRFIQFKDFPEGSPFARSDGFPDYKKKFSSQFDSTKLEFTDLTSKYNLDKLDYFQSGLLFYDTDIIDMILLMIV